MRSNNRKKLPEFSAPSSLTDERAVASLREIVSSRDKNRISDVIYKGSKPEFIVRKTLREIYFNKCAYCEIPDSKPEVEHYRPKGKVAEDSNHPGYYWLCYEWTNLLPSCHYCNTETGKVNSFPVSGIRVMSPPLDEAGNSLFAAHTLNSAGLANEKPLLLHPEADTPDNGSYFRFDYTGKIYGIDSRGRGAATIDICDLNRDNLLTFRLKFVTAELILNLEKALDKYYKGEIADVESFVSLLRILFEVWIRGSHPAEPFSLFALYAQNNFIEIIAEDAGKTSEQRLILTKVYEDFVEERNFLPA